MAASNPRIAPLGFLLVSVLLFVAGLLPALRGGRLRVAFLSAGLLFVIMGAVAWRKAAATAGLPPA